MSKIKLLAITKEEERLLTTPDNALSDEEQASKLLLEEELDLAGLGLSDTQTNSTYNKLSRELEALLIGTVDIVTLFNSMSGTKYTFTLDPATNAINVTREIRTYVQVDPVQYSPLADGSYDWATIEKELFPDGEIARAGSTEYYKIVAEIWKKTAESFSYSGGDGWTEFLQKFDTLLGNLPNIYYMIQKDGNQQIVPIHEDLGVVPDSEALLFDILHLDVPDAINVEPLSDGAVAITVAAEPTEITITLYPIDDEIRSEIDQYITAKHPAFAHLIQVNLSGLDLRGKDIDQAIGQRQEAINAQAEKQVFDHVQKLLSNKFPESDPEDIELFTEDLWNEATEQLPDNDIISLFEQGAGRI
jgi:hypothetical protein